MDKLKKIFEKIKSIKHIEIYAVILIASVCVLIYVFVASADKKASTTSSTNSEDSLTSQIEEVLSCIEGVGECHVMITYCAPNVAESVETSSSIVNDNGYSSSVSNTVSTPVVISKNGTSQLLYLNSTNIYGVVVVCDGGNNIKVINNIISAIKTLLNVDGLNIQVYKTN